MLDFAQIEKKNVYTEKLKKIRSVGVFKSVMFFKSIMFFLSQ